MITGVVVAAVVVAVVLLGLPLLAWWMSRWQRWERPAPAREDDPWVNVLRRHRLSPAEVHRLAPARRPLRAVARARLTDPGLRAAVVDWEQWYLRRAEARAAHPGAVGVLFRVVEAPMRSQYRRIIGRHGGSAVPVLGRDDSLSADALEPS